MGGQREHQPITNLYSKSTHESVLLLTMVGNEVPNVELRYRYREPMSYRKFMSQFEIYAALKVYDDGLLSYLMDFCSRSEELLRVA